MVLFRVFCFAGSSQQPPLGQASVCTGTYSLGETSQAQAPPSRSKGSETPPSRVISAKLGVTTPPKSPSKSPSKSLFTNLVLGIKGTPAAPLVTTGATPSEVIHL